MSEHYPHIRILLDNGGLLLREAVSVCFYMRRPHEEIAALVARSLDTYVEATGAQLQHWVYTTAMEDPWAKYDDGHPERVDAATLAAIREEILSSPSPRVSLFDAFGEKRYLFDYIGASAKSVAESNGAVCAVHFTFPTEYLEQHGPERLRELVLEFARPLPFSSGQAGLSFSGLIQMVRIWPLIHQFCFRYPGLDLIDIERAHRRLGARITGPAWLTFLGQPVFEQMGGAAGLRSRIHEPGSTVQELEEHRAVVTLGTWPEAGDLRTGRTLPAYRELARILDPWLDHEEDPREAGRFNSPEDRQRWERRFLD